MNDFREAVPRRRGNAVLAKPGTKRNSSLMPSRRILLLALSAFLGVAARPATAFNSCYDYCLDKFSCQASVTREEQNCHDTCEDMCRRGGVLYNTWNSSNPVDAYGAIAYGRESAAAGWAYGQRSAAAAKRVALTNCSAHGNDCKIAASFMNRCGAVAASGLTVGADEGASRQEAEANAIVACRRRGGGRCKIEAWSCAR
ncbi:MAG: DUF4189 domain-containing protein [Alphaproteobacteria bacterium]|nr:DUF4189 domain-containing protein [Alphaproteobacteria bacterium]